MRLIDRYILRELGGIFLFGVAIFTGLLLVITHLFFVARVAADVGLPIRTSLALLVLKVPYFVVFALPMSMLLATLLAFGRLSDRNEISAMRTTGWSLGRITAPVLLVGVVVTGVSLYMNEYVVPKTESRYGEMFAQAVRAPVRKVLRDVLFREPVDGVESVFFARELDAHEGVMSRVVITQFLAGRPARLIEAGRARYGPDGWVLEDGTIYLLGDAIGVKTEFRRMRVALRRTPQQMAAARRDPAEMTIRELREEIAALRAAGESVVRYAVNLHFKLALPASSVIFALLAVPLGLRPHQSGRSTGLGLTILVVLAYYVMMTVTLQLGERGQLTPILAAWLPNMSVGAAGLYLLRTAW